MSVGRIPRPRRPPGGAVSPFLDARRVLLVGRKSGDDQPRRIRRPLRVRRRVVEPEPELEAGSGGHGQRIAEQPRLREGHAPVRDREQRGPAAFGPDRVEPYAAEERAALDDDSDEGDSGMARACTARTPSGIQGFFRDLPRPEACAVDLGDACEMGAADLTILLGARGTIRADLDCDSVAGEADVAALLGA